MFAGAMWRAQGGRMMSVEPWLAAHLPVLDLALDAVRAVQRASARAGGRTEAAEPAPLDPARVATAFASDRVLALDGQPVEGFAALSGFFPTADGWVRTHANYPHHRSRLTALAGLPDDVGRAAFARRLTELLRAGARGRRGRRRRDRGPRPYGAGVAGVRAGARRGVGSAGADTARSR